MYNYPACMTKRRHAKKQYTIENAHEDPVKHICFDNDHMYTCTQNMVREWRSHKNAYTLIGELECNVNIRHMRIYKNNIYIMTDEGILVVWNGTDYTQIVNMCVGNMNIINGYLYVFSEGEIKCMDINNEFELICVYFAEAELLCISVYDNMIISSGKTGNIYMWRMGESMPIFNITGEHNEKSINLITSDDKYIYTAGLDGCIRCWTFGDVGLFCVYEIECDCAINGLIACGGYIYSANNRGYITCYVVGAIDNEWDHCCESKLLSMAILNDNLFVGRKDGHIDVWSLGYPRIHNFMDQPKAIQDEMISVMMINQRYWKLPRDIIDIIFSCL